MGFRLRVTAGHVMMVSFTETRRPVLDLIKLHDFVAPHNRKMFALQKLLSNAAETALFLHCNQRKTGVDRRNTGDFMHLFPHETFIVREVFDQ